MKDPLDPLDVGPERVNALASELANCGHVVLDLGGPEAMVVIGCLQLALRHPQAPDGAGRVATYLIRRMAGQMGPEVERLVEESW
jgi:hypothetical protein